jgi:hypothetical protein
MRPVLRVLFHLAIPMSMHQVLPLHMDARLHLERGPQARELVGQWSLVRFLPLLIHKQVRRDKARTAMWKMRWKWMRMEALQSSAVQELAIVETGELKRGKRLSNMMWKTLSTVRPLLVSVASNSHVHIPLVCRPITFGPFSLLDRIRGTCGVGDWSSRTPAPTCHAGSEKTEVRRLPDRRECRHGGTEEARMEWHTRRATADFLDDIIGTLVSSTMFHVERVILSLS